MAYTATVPATDRGEIKAMPALITTRQAAEIGNWSERFVRILCEKGPNNGGIKAVKIGRTWRVDRDALLAQLGL